MKPMHIKGENGTNVLYRGIGEDKLNELSDLVCRCLETTPQVLIAVIGNKGVGKSVLGKYFRNRGFGCIPPRQIAVIDDDNMAVDFLYFFRRWHAEPCRGVDELAPFFRYCKNKPVRVYIKSNPESRISKANVILKVTVDENRRRQQLIRRYGPVKGDAVFRQTMDYAQKTNIAFDHELEAEIQHR